MFYIVLMIALNTVQFTSVDRVNLTITGADPGFQVGGGGALKKIAPIFFPTLRGAPLHL